jgi:hypothetical protein
VVTASPLLEAAALASGVAVELREVDDVNELVGVTVRVRVGEGHLACWFMMSSPMGPSSTEPDDQRWQQATNHKNLQAHALHSTQMRWRAQPRAQARAPHRDVTTDTALRKGRPHLLKDAPVPTTA